VHPIDLARHDEIVLVQSFDLLSAQGDDRITPAEADVRVISVNASILLGYMYVISRHPHGIGRWSQSEPFPGIVTLTGFASKYRQLRSRALSHFQSFIRLRQNPKRLY
jgi:hypothetical protein